jgi:hypothetical protein
LPRDPFRAHVNPTRKAKDLSKSIMRILVPIVRDVPKRSDRSGRLIALEDYRFQTT